MAYSTERKSYSKKCDYCGQLITMSELTRGNWQPWEVDGSGQRHVCGSGHATSDVTSPRPALSWESVISSSETYLTRCPWCQHHVYYHTNGNGDRVYFDNLGYPWNIHPCWEQYWKEQKDRQRVLTRLSNQITLNEQKLQILAGVLRSAPSQIIDDCLLYSIDEPTLAQRLGMLVKRLRQDYEHLYQVTPSGIKLLNPRRQVIVTRSNSIVVSSKILHDLVQCEQCGKMIWKRKLNEHLKAAHPLPMAACDHCNKRVPKRWLQQHLKECVPKIKECVSKKKGKRKTKGKNRKANIDSGATNIKFRRRII